MAAAATRAKHGRRAAAVKAALRKADRRPNGVNAPGHRSALRWPVPLCRRSTERGVDPLAEQAQLVMDLHQRRPT